MSGTFFDKIFPFRGLPTSIYVLFIARIINRMGDLVRFFLTLYLTQVLEMPPAEVGLVITAAALATMAGGLSAGKMADRFGRKRIMLWSQCLSAVLLLLCGFHPEAEWLPYLLVASQFFFGATRPASQALVTDLTPVEDRGKAFSLLYFGINIGISLGPLIAGFLFENHRRWIFWGDAGTTLIGVILVAALVHEAPTDEIHRGDRREDADVSSSAKALAARPILAVFFAIMVVTNFIYAQTHFTIPLLMDRLFAAQSAQKFGLLMSVNAITVLVFTPLFLSIMGQGRPARNMALGGLCYALGFGCLAVIPGTMAWILASTVVWTWGEVIFAINVRVFSTAYTPLNHRSRFASIEQASWALGAVLSPAITGAVTQAIGLRWVWLPISMLSVLIIAALMGLDRWNRLLRNDDDH